LLHVEELDAAVAEEYVPAKQLVHPVDPEVAEYFPGRQSGHELTPELAALGEADEVNQ
jgi:hypothetical protein